MPTHYSFKCKDCGLKQVRYRNSKRCRACRGELEIFSVHGLSDFPVWLSRKEHTRQLQQAFENGRETERAAGYGELEY